MNTATALDECLNRLAAGESLASCLERYPEQARDLEPMLQAAQRLAVLPEVRLTEAQKLRARVAIRATLAEQRGRRPVRWWARLAPTAAAIAFVLFAGVAVTAVAGSQPGDIGYGVRVVMERAPALVQMSNQRRASAELAVAGRRLEDIEAAKDADNAYGIALDALIRSVDTAALRAEKLPAEQRTVIASDLRQKEAALLRLAEGTLDSRFAARLRNAAEQVGKAALRLESLPVSRGPAGGEVDVDALVLEPDAERIVSRPSAGASAGASRSTSNAGAPAGGVIPDSGVAPEPDAAGFVVIAPTGQPPAAAEPATPIVSGSKQATPTPSGPGLGVKGPARSPTAPGAGNEKRSPGQLKKTVEPPKRSAPKPEAPRPANGRDATPSPPRSSR